MTLAFFPKKPCYVRTLELDRESISDKKMNANYSVQKNTQHCVNKNKNDETISLLQF